MTLWKMWKDDGDVVDDDDDDHENFDNSITGSSIQGSLIQASPGICALSTPGAICLTWNITKIKIHQLVWYQEGKK